MDPEYFRINLQPGTLSGRYDARVTLPNHNSPGREIDPSDTLNTPSFQLRIGQYLANSLLYTNPSIYVLASGAINTWDFSHDGQSLPDTVPDLASAMAQNPRLKVISVNGYHDIVTPFHTTERDLARLGNPDDRGEDLHRGAHDLPRERLAPRHEGRSRGFLPEGPCELTG